MASRFGGGVQRLVTAAVLVPLALLAIFQLPSLVFFVLIVVLLGWGAFEYVGMLQGQAEGAPLRALLVLFPLVAFALYEALSPDHSPGLEGWLLAVGLFVTVGVGTLLLASRTPVEKVPAALGILGFGIPYFALPAASIAVMQALDPWWVVLLVAVVWLGDTAAYYVGSAIGRHKMAPRISPKKSWEGAAASLAAALLSAVVWCLLRLDGVDLGIVVVAGVTGVVAQLGDLFESMLKRGVNVKDSGAVLPGHGGMLDRMDAILWAAPVLLAGLWWLRLEGFHL